MATDVPTLLYRLLPLFSGYSHLHLRLNVASDQFDLLPDIRRPGRCLVSTCRHILEACKGRDCDSAEVAVRGGCVHLHILHVRLVSSDLDFVGDLGLPFRVTGGGSQYANS